MKVQIVSHRAALNLFFGFAARFGFEESFTLKRKVLLSILAAASVAFLPLAAAAQASSAADRPAPSYKYEASIGYGYTSLNQVNGSRYGLQGIDASVARGFGKYFNLMAQGDYYKYAFNTGGSTNTGNPGDPSISSALFGPMIHAPIAGKVEGFVKILIGGEHTGGEGITPKLSFAGGYGGGLDYKLNSRFALRLSGEKILASFSPINNTTALGYSSHRSSDARAAFGVVYHF